MKVKHIAKLVWKVVDENAPTILMVLAEIGLVGTVISAINDAPIAQDKLTDAKMDKAEEIERTDPASMEKYRIENEESAEPLYDLTKIRLTPWEYVQILAPVYWKTAVGFAITSTCIFLGPHIAKKRYLLALGLLASREKEIEKYKDKVKELFGEKKVQQIEDKIAQDIVDDAPDELNVFYTGDGNQLFYDTASHTWFRSSRECVDRAINQFNAQLLEDEEATVADLAYHYGYQLMDNYDLDRMMWTYDVGKKNLLKAEFSYCGHPRTQEPCCVIRYDRHPIYQR